MKNQYFSNSASLKLFNPLEKEELEAALDSRPKLQLWGSRRFEEMKGLFPKKRSSMQVIKWKEDF